MWETCVRSLGWEDLLEKGKAPLEKGMPTHPSIFAWKTPQQRSLVGYSPWGHRVLPTERLSLFIVWLSGKEYSL